MGEDKAVYVGGTATIVKDKEAVLDVSDEKVVTYTDWKVPYEKITALSYGQHAGRRVGATVALGVTTLGIGALPVLFSKKRRHYLTIEDAVRTTLKTLEVRSGKKVEYEDEEAKKTGNK